MRNFLALLIAIAVVAIVHRFSSTAAVFDSNDEPSVKLFASADCSRECENIRELFQKRNVLYQEVNVSQADRRAALNEYGIPDVPAVVIAGKVLVRSDLSEVSRAVKSQVISSKDHIVLDNHFDVGGKPLVVLYGADWCEYCKQERAVLAANKVEFTYLNVESSASDMATYKALGGTVYPLTYVGSHRVSGYNPSEVVRLAKELANTRLVNIH
jgi:glutaredoxin